jgi:hypothetical protein
MRGSRKLLVTATFVAVVHASARGQGPAARALPAISPTPSPSVAILASRLDLERYKATIKGLTQFGDRRQGTERNRKDVRRSVSSTTTILRPRERDSRQRRAPRNLLFRARSGADGRAASARLLA